MRGQRIITVLRGNTYNMPLVISLYSNFKWATSLSVILSIRNLTLIATLSHT